MGIDSECHLMFTYIGDPIFNRKDTLIVIYQNCVSYKNYGRSQYVVEKYPYGDVAGRRKPCDFLKSISRVEDRGHMGDCIINGPPEDVQGPTIATLMTQFGIGRPLETNNIAQKIVENSKNLNLVYRLKNDTSEGRQLSFSHSMFKLTFSLARINKDHIKNIVIPVGIGKSGSIDDVWLTKYLPVIHKFSNEMKEFDKRVILISSEEVQNCLHQKYSDRSDEVAQYYRSLFVNLPLVHRYEFLCNDVTNHQDLEEEDTNFVINENASFLPM